MKHYSGLLFLDCYGRVFESDDMSGVIRLFGDYFKSVGMVSRGCRTKWEEWLVEYDGSVVKCD